jgi:hypothetical protein
LGFRISQSATATTTVTEMLIFKEIISRSLLQKNLFPGGFGYLVGARVEQDEVHIRQLRPGGDVVADLFEHDFGAEGQIEFGDGAGYLRFGASRECGVWISH